MHFRMVDSEASAPACGLDMFSTMSVAATVGEFKAVFLEKCEATYPGGVCTAAISELWDGEDMNAALESPSSEFCVRLRRIVDVAQRSSLAGQSVEFTGMNLAVSKKVKAASDEDLDEGELDGDDDAPSDFAGESESGAVATRHVHPVPAPADPICVDDDELGRVCALPGADSCGSGFTPFKKKCKQAADLIFAEQGTERTKFRKNEWRNRPAGCSVRDSQVFFNKNEDGNNNGDFDLICIEMSHEPVSDFPAGMLQCDGVAARKTSCSADLDNLNTAIREDVKAHFNSLDTGCSGASCPRGDLAGCLVRLVGHDIMDFNPDLNTGGADGCIDFADPDNIGLRGCMLTAVHERDSSNVSLESMWQAYCTEVSAADFFVIAAEALIEATLPDEHRAKWGSTFHLNFQFGRETQVSCTPEPLPVPTDSCDAVGAVFVERMQLTWTQSVALMGVHTLGRALPENSGYDGFWVSGHQAMTFDNMYFARIIGAGWTIETTSEGKSQWKRADLVDGEMMLNTDMCLAFQSGMAAPWTRAEDTSHSGCCLWIADGNDALDGVQCHCQAQGTTQCQHGNCCASTGGCPNSNPFSRSGLVRFQEQNESLAAITKYANTDTGMDSWFDDFITTWNQVTTQGHVHDLCPRIEPPTPAPTPMLIIGMPNPENPPTTGPVTPAPTPAPTPMMIIGMPVPPDLHHMGPVHSH